MVVEPFRRVVNMLGACRATKSNGLQSRTEQHCYESKRYFAATLFPPAQIEHRMCDCFSNLVALYRL